MQERFRTILDQTRWYSARRLWIPRLSAGLLWLEHHGSILEGGRAAGTEMLSVRSLHSFCPGMAFGLLDILSKRLTLLVVETLHTLFEDLWEGCRT